MDNVQKAETYKALKGRLKRAMINGFWFEACMIEYAIMEDRTSSILQHSGICKEAFDPGKMLSRKVGSIKHQIGKKHPVISKKVDINLMNDIDKWRNERNDVVHRSCNHVYDEEKVRAVAERGNDIVRRLINDSRKVSNYYKKNG